jgi:hypothetical protein
MVQDLGEMDPRDPRRDMVAAAANELTADEMAERDRVFVEVLRDCTAALGESSIRYGLIGGIASSGYGRPRWTHDIDVFCRPEDAERVLDVLGHHGFETERTDPHWLFKGFKRDVLVDVIFQSHGAIYLDCDMIEHIVLREHLGVVVPLIAPEDLLVMKAVVHDEQGPRHWHDALGLIAGGRLDWGYLLRRGQRAPRRVLSLLVYAHSLDLDVPNKVIKDLYSRVYES